MSTKNTILRVRLYGGGYIATDVADGQRKVSCTAGAEPAARAWATKFAPFAAPADVREAFPGELNGIDQSKDESGQYVTYWSVPAAEVAGPLITDITTAQLYLHPSLERIALVPDAAAALLGSHHGDKARQERGQELVEDWAAWVEEIRQHGVREPIRVIRRPAGESECRPLPGYWVIDGRHRFTGAVEAGKTVVPCIVVEETDANALAAGSVIGRRHWTKSQRAFFAVILHPEVADVEAAKSRAKAGKPSAVSAEGLATRFGVSVRLIQQAIEFYRGLEKHPQHKPRFEPSLWGGSSLEHLIAGLNAIDAGTSGPGVPVLRHPPANIRKAWASEQAASHNFSKLPPEAISNFERDLRLQTEGMAPDYLAWKMAIITDVLATKGGER